MAEPKNLADLDGAQSVSALGLRWAALRGMLASPLIHADDQRSLREELVRELGNLEKNFISIQSRNVMEVSAKIDIAKSALRENLQSGETWLVDLLESIQSDLHSTNARTASASPVRPPVNISRAYQHRADETGAAEAESDSTPNG